MDVRFRQILSTIERIGLQKFELRSAMVQILVNQDLEQQCIFSFIYRIDFPFDFQEKYISFLIVIF